MKQLKTQIRLYIAEWLLGKILTIAPKNNKECQELISLIGFYFITKIK